MTAMRLSINVERLEDLRAYGNLYHPTDAAVGFVRRVASAALSGGAAHALQGPFGVGKSSLVAFALNELGHPTPSFVPNRRSSLFAESDPVAKVVEAGGLAAMPIVGAAEPLRRRVANAMKVFAECAPDDLASPAILHCRSIKPDEVGHDMLLRLLADMAGETRQRGTAGVLLAIDEFGRHLAHMLQSPQEDDLHFLQSLAEMTGRAGAPLSLLIVQHYGLEHYSGRLPSARREEWEKVRGRFRETVLHNTETDSALILAKTLPSMFRCKHRRPPKFKAHTKSPQILRNDTFLAAAAKCRPLHPMTVVLLARLGGLVGQQDRTAVGWMTSDAPTGFGAVLAQTREAWVRPDSLFDHFLADPFAAPANPVIAKRSAAAHDAYERGLEVVSGQALRLLKTLALLNFTGGRGLSANAACLSSCLPSRFPLRKSLNELIAKSLIVHRRYKDEYSVWEGSDYDMDRRVLEAASARPFDFASEMNRRFPRETLAHGHLVKTGHRRSAQVLWLESYEPPPPGNGAPRVLIGAGRAVAKSGADVTASAEIGALTPHLRESSAIRHLMDEDAAELQGDPVATKELRTRLDFHEFMVSSLYEGILASNLKWCAANRTFPTLQQALSAAMGLAYPCTFTLHNELVNHDQVSGQVIAGLRRLLERLCSSPEQENLGIEKFPPERIIYESLLKRTGLHRPAKDGWALRLDGKIPDANLAKVIAEVHRLFTSSDLAVSRVAEQLGAPPFGVKRVPALLLCGLVLLVGGDDYELREDLRFLPDWSAQTLLRMIKAPSRFSVSASAKAPIGKHFMRNYRTALVGPRGQRGHSPLAIVRDLLAKHTNLSEHARQTSMVSDRAQAFRRAIRTAKSPGDMLFRAIPQAMGVSSLSEMRPDEATEYFRKIRLVQDEIERADEALLDRLADAAQDTLAVRSLKELRAKCGALTAGLPVKGSFYHNHQTFIELLACNESPSESAWFAGLVDHGLGIATPIGSWGDSQAAQAEFLLRRNLLGLQSAGKMISHLRLQADASPFAVFWPNGDAQDECGVKDAVRSLAAMVRDIPESRRMATVIGLARIVQEGKL